LEEKMSRYYLGAVAALAMLAVPVLPSPGHAQAVPGTNPPDYQLLCTNGVRKLDLGVEVIGARPSQIERARAAAARAKDQMQKGDYYGCAESVRAGLGALDAG
jgi:hypothetical protein